MRHPFHSAWAPALAAIATLLTRQASAQVDAERFKPAVTPDGWLQAEGSGIRESADPFELGAYANFAGHPLIVKGGDGSRVHSFVSHRLGFDFIASVTPVEPLSIGIDLPMFIAQGGDANPSFGGLGNLRVVPKLRILDDRKNLGLAVAVEVRAPTHTGDYSGDSKSFAAIPKVILDHRFRGGLRIGFNTGVMLKQGDRFSNVSMASEFQYAAAIGYRFGGMRGKTELAFELDGGVGLVEQDAEELPLEGLAFLRQALGSDVDLTVGGGMGLVGGYGVPTYRFVVGLRGRPTSHDRDRDGIPDDEDTCPDEAEDTDRYQDLDGCPEDDPDGDQDGVPDWNDKCPSDKETINGVKDEDGCPDSGDPRVIYEDGELKLLDQIQFEHGSSTLTPESQKTLDQVALTMKAHPEFKSIRVEGHTDDTGPEDVNQRLSEERAASVRHYLIGRGVAGRRLTSKGYGESQPLKEGTSERAREKNRRVQFVVETDTTAPTRAANPARTPEPPKAKGKAKAGAGAQGGASLKGGASVKGSAQGQLRIGK